MDVVIVFIVISVAVLAFCHMVAVFLYDLHDQCTPRVQQRAQRLFCGCSCRVLRAPRAAEPGGGAVQDGGAAAAAAAGPAFVPHPGSAPTPARRRSRRAIVGVRWACCNRRCSARLPCYAGAAQEQSGRSLGQPALHEPKHRQPALESGASSAAVGVGVVVVKPALRST
jgi:hypothetical protein